METKSIVSKVVRKSSVYKNSKLSVGEVIISDLKLDIKGNLFLNDYPEYPVMTATSCLVDPCENDKVSALFDGQTFFITTILQRMESKKDIVLNLREANLRVFVANMEINAEKSVNFDTKHYVVRAQKTELYSSLSKYVYNEVYTVAYNSYKNVEENDELHSNNLFIKVAQTCTVKNKIGIIQSDAILKIDGGQVHMG